MLSDDSLFAETTKETLANWSRPDYPYPSTPLALLKSWKAMIEICKKGYQDNISEYDNDLSIREAIELVLSSERSKEYPEFTEFLEKVNRLDEEFSEFLQTDITRSEYANWWLQRAPKYGCAELADDFFQIYGIRITVV